MKCYCCSGREFEDCCQPFIKGLAKPATAEALMRSRYSAYATVEVNIFCARRILQRANFITPKLIKNWARSKALRQKLENRFHRSRQSAGQTRNG